MEKEPVYIVTSFHRSGSSMMMRCLEAGGIKTVKDNGQEILNIIWGREGYKPNPNGFYGLEDDSRVDWPSFYEDTKGKVVKIPRLDLNLLPQGKYKVIFMTRNPKEILASIHKFSPYISWGFLGVVIYFYDLIKSALFKSLSKRGDFEILDINYVDVINNPQKEFQKIKDFGFPIDIQKASDMVDPTLYRLRLEK